MKITAAKIKDAKTTQHNFTDAICDDAKHFFVEKYAIARDATQFEKDVQA